MSVPPAGQLDRVVVGSHLREGAELVRVPPGPAGHVGEHQLLLLEEVLGRSGRVAVESGGLPRREVVGRFNSCVVRSTIWIILTEWSQVAGAPNGPH